MMTIPLKGYLFPFIFVLAAGACRGTTGGRDREDQPSGEKWHMTDEIQTPAEAGPEAVEAMLQAAFDGDLAGMRALLKQGVPCNATDQDGHTALMYAAYNGHSELVAELIEAGAEVNKRDGMDQTALMYGSTGPFPETVKLLLEHGADPNLVDSNEHFSALMHAAAEGNLEVVKLLIAAGANPSLKDVDGDDAAVFAVQRGQTEVVEYLKTIN
jgi:uncharacterized protein